MAKSDPPYVPRATDRGHPNPRPPQQPTAGKTPGNPGHSGPGGSMSKSDSTRESSGNC